MSIRASQGSPALIALPASIKHGFKVKDKVENSQLSVLAHKHLGSEHPVEIWNVDKVKIGSHISFIYEKQPRSKTTVRKMSHYSELNKTLKE